MDHGISKANEKVFGLLKLILIYLSKPQKYILSSIQDSNSLYIWFYSYYIAQHQHFPTLLEYL